MPIDADLRYLSYMQGLLGVAIYLGARQSHGILGNIIHHSIPMKLPPWATSLVTTSGRVNVAAAALQLWGLALVAVGLFSAIGIMDGRAAAVAAFATLLLGPAAVLAVYVVLAIDSVRRRK